MDAVQRTSLDEKRCTAIVVDTGDAGAHLGKRLHDPFHGAFLDRSVSGQRDIKALGA